jgi:hypothetical protein
MGMDRRATRGMIGGWLDRILSDHIGAPNEREKAWVTIFYPTLLAKQQYGTFYAPAKHTWLVVTVGVVLSLISWTVAIK